MRPLLAITMGDAAGIGPEIIVKCLSDPSVYERCRPLVVGDIAILKAATKWAPKSDLYVRQVAESAEGTYTFGTIDVLQPTGPLGPVTPGQLSAEAGRAAVAYLQTAARLARADQVDGIVTAPLNKKAMHLAGYRYPGHTEILAEAFGVDQYSLVLTTGRLFVFHVTTHVGLRTALDLLTPEKVLSTVRLAHRLARALGRGEEIVAVMGVNPHAGEEGLFGNEEERIIAPAVAAAKSEGIPTVGPLPADAAFPQAIKGRYSFLVAMYHDQGHAPFKSVYGERGVNITVGLPRIRTSVDHGTAFDIAGQGVASAESLHMAIRMAADLAPVWGKIWETAEA